MLQSIFIILTLISIQGFAATRLQFFFGDQNAIALLTPTDSYGNSDSDSSDLYKMMNVPEQDSMLGKGKSIMSSARDFNLVCSQYKGQCQVVLAKSANVQIRSAKKSMSYSVSGESATQLVKLFQLNDLGEVKFEATDRLFRIYGNAKEFIFEAGQY
ncbi:MAG: hypothetical protein A2622_07400 [Bdellovibrionales bacterium RIFCSPHIGHO2_01_FULL_40_29]|nr:MAG: hypothetical protein A2622_07400 [Bdellovibrionales bacterium RIFCSPHIGHO2_01_FULL_40_29]OFZ34251.1 MAG: hypothetical protein A3D17_04250 [Bdellovibrionales bacterium RIFCSPHIGHO2_02_FULL_40_15]